MFMEIKANFKMQYRTNSHKCQEKKQWLETVELGFYMRWDG